MLEYFRDLITLFKNKTLNALGVERDFLTHVRDNDITGAISMMNDNDDDVDIAITEYYPEKHKVMKRPNKARKNKSDYISTKLPRKRQQFINEVALFFLLNKPIDFKLSSTGEKDAEAFDVFQQFKKNLRFDSLMRETKRLAGAETECAKLYHIYKDDEGKPQCKCIVLARSKGYKLRTLIDQYGNMEAFAYGYTTKSEKKNVEHWDIQTKDFIFNCTRGAGVWKMKTFPNPTGKINIVYYRQKKEWDGVQLLCDREEDILSRAADNNNYFSDPIAVASADVIDFLRADSGNIGKMIQLQGNSRFEYVNPPQVSDGWRTEKEDLKSAILNDSFTPDFTYEGIKGYGTLSGAALRNAMTIGYIKRNKNLEIYDEGVDREINIMKAFLKISEPQYDWDAVEIRHEFVEPFTDDEEQRRQSIATLYSAGLCSLETAVGLLALTDTTEAEIDRIRMQDMEKMQAEQQLQAEAQNGAGAQPQPNNEQPVE